MTGHPEAVLARELELCYTSLTLVTDLDAGVETGEGVSHAEVLKVFGENVGRCAMCSSTRWAACRRALRGTACARMRTTAGTWDRAAVAAGRGHASLARVTELSTNLRSYTGPGGIGRGRAS